MMIPLAFGEEQATMSSILTNISAMSALQTLRMIGNGLEETQSRVSSGLRVKTAADDAAYWSISTTMRSDNAAISAVSDALGLGAAKVDTAYAGLEAVVDVLSDFKAKLVTATEDGVDKAKVQEELDQLKQQVVAISEASSFSGENWLSTDIEDIYDNSQNTKTVVSSFVRDGTGNVSVKRTDVPLSEIALFNQSGGGLLEADPRNLKSVGGLRFAVSAPIGTTPYSNYSRNNQNGFDPYGQQFMFPGPMTFAAGDQISFDITIDADNPSDPIDPPYHPGTTTSVIINRAVVDSVLPGANGIISDYKEYTAVLGRALAGSGAYATNYWTYDPPNTTKNRVDVPDKVGIVHNGLADLDGSSFQISNVTSTVGNTGISEMAGPDFGVRRSSMSLEFERFTVFDEVVVSFRFRVGNETYSNYSFDRAHVNAVLGRNDGVVATASDMATLLNSLINRPDVIIEPTETGNISVRTDTVMDRKSGSKSAIAFTGININIEPIPTMNFLDIDIEAHPENLDTYISYIDVSSQRVISATATVGALKSRIDMQSEFTEKLISATDRGIGRLVDADMNEESTRLKALQTQQQLAIQALSIANSETEAMMQLFR